MREPDFNRRVEYFTQHLPDNCPILHTLDVIGSKWKIPIIWHLLLQDGQHYNELKRSVGQVTNTMLTKSLRELERDGLIRRKDYGTIPPSVTYHLTDLGKALMGAMSALFDWGVLHRSQINQVDDK